MKYSELHKKLRKAGCYMTGGEICGHPEWYSPITGKRFGTSHHNSQEVKRGTLKNIVNASGVKI
ncbi:MAG: type II toxin-antitoxin system HicA family toxin [Muribaculaceae bacterium]|nr:type II toxin-antitoxin system HicA family toxin [Muribaculaceae bacterium]